MARHERGAGGGRQRLPPCAAGFRHHPGVLAQGKKNGVVAFDSGFTGGFSGQGRFQNAWRVHESSGGRFAPRE